jgi:type IV secretory pathway VirB2 component (pilin)
MKRLSFLARLTVPILLMATHASAGAGGAPWDTQMSVIWQSITGGPFAALVLGTGIIGSAWR